MARATSRGTAAANIARLRICERETSVRQAAQRWQLNNYSAELLLRGRDLARAERWARAHDDELTDVERDLLEDSKYGCEDAAHADGRRRFLGATATIMAFACLALMCLLAQATEEKAKLARAEGRLAALVESMSAAKETAEAMHGDELELRRTAQAAEKVALAAKREAQAALRDHRSRSLAAWSRVSGEDDLSLGVLLALESATMALRPGSEASTRSLARKALLDATLRTGLGLELQLPDGDSDARPAWASADGRCLAYASGGRLLVMEIEHHGRVRDIGPCLDEPVYLSWRADGRMALGVGAQGSLTAWDIELADMAWKVETGASRVSQVAWSPDGDAVAAAFGGLEEALGIWGTDEGHSLLTLKLPDEILGVSSVAWHLNGQRLQITDGDGNSLAWESGAIDLTSLAQIPEADILRPVRDAISCFLLGGDDVAPTLYVQAIPEIVSLACAAAGRNMSRAEWTEYMGTGSAYRRTCPDLPGGR